MSFRFVDLIDRSKLCVNNKELKLDNVVHDDASISASLSRVVVIKLVAMTTYTTTQPHASTVQGVVD